jgi:rhodanese-related sulfurtransferase
MAQLIEFCLRHPLLVGGTVMALIAALANELRLRGQAGVSVPPTEAVRLINQGATVVDVREKASYDVAHIVDAINLAADDLAGAAESRLKKKRPVLLVCDTGSRSARLVSGLRQAGFDSAWSLDGGLAAWQRDNLPVVGSRNRG